MFKTGSSCAVGGICLAVLLWATIVFGSFGDLVSHGITVAASVVFLVIFVPSALLVLYDKWTMALVDGVERLSGFVWGFVVWGTLLPFTVIGWLGLARYLFSESSH